MRYLAEIFWRHSLDICTLIQNNFKFLVCLSDCSLFYIFTKIRLIVDIYSSGWGIFLKFFGDIPGMLVHYFQIILNFLYVSQSVCLLTSVLKLDKCWDIYSSGWDISLKFFGDIPGMLVHYFQIILNFLYVSKSVCLLTSLPNLD